MAEFDRNGDTKRAAGVWHAAILRFGAVLVAGSVLAACAAVPTSDDPDALAEYKEINDPIEPVNRVIFEFNRGLDTLFLRPAATFYKGMTPPELQDMVHNFLNNLKTPVVLLNDLLQGEAERAEVTLARFAINTTVGILGLGDPATDMGYARHDEDFGQTLGAWGMDEGPYLVLPVLGPSNPRDTVGIVVDYLTDPINRWADNTDREYVPNQRFAAGAVDFRATNMEEIDDLQRTSLDYYAAVRSLYRQVRADEIRNGAPPFNHGLPAMGSMEDPDAEEPALATKN